METRTTINNEVKIYKLILNPMMGNAENLTVVAIAYDKDKLMQWYRSLLEETPYEDVGAPSFACHGDSHKWHKFFKKGSELEWFNTCRADFEPNSFGEGIGEQWVTQDAINTCGVKLIV